MAENTINDFAHLIKQQTASQELIYETVMKAKVLLDHALEENVLQLPPHITSYYFWVVSDLTNRAAELSEKALDLLVKAEQARTNSLY